MAFLTSKDIKEIWHFHNGWNRIASVNVGPLGSKLWPNEEIVTVLDGHKAEIDPWHSNPSFTSDYFEISGYDSLSGTLRTRLYVMYDRDEHGSSAHARLYLVDENNSETLITEHAYSSNVYGDWYSDKDFSYNVSNCNGRYRLKLTISKSGHEPITCTATVTGQLMLK